ncbi:ATP-dependent RNA helicase RhlE [Saezia sanguinis]|uniref:DEAD-box ATP-dependent RNA helicase RhpA n=2 Tax=Saezia sanguinis TaxID=1965230 RepID=A0A433SEW2_9BURK|nr:ATP-dependent RNA helicase RhlE [Saezia sanguinis]
METSFFSLALADSLQKAIKEMGYTSMTPIQAKAIPMVLDNHDVMGAAQTGTGKTAAFSLPLLQKMLKHENSSMSPARHPVRAVVLLPTRELADQVAESVRAYAKHTKLKIACVFGGMDMKPQAAELKGGVEVLIATPGRLLDHIEARNCVLNQVEYVVLDEADRMLDIGFLPDLQRILSYLPKQRQTLLFSATFSPEIKRLAQSYLHDPQLVEVARPNATATNIEQRVIEVADSDKRRALVKLLRDENITQAIVFSNSKIGTSRLARALERDGFKTAALHGDKSQDERLKALEAFKQGEVTLLVATDVAARGLDVSDLPAVFNYDLPFHAEDYVHRIGRTGRAGAKGMAVSFVEPGQRKLLAEIERLVKKTFTLERIELADEHARPHRTRERASDEGERRSSQRNRGYKERLEREPSADASEVGYALPQGKRSSDPLFDQPYQEPENTTEQAAWDVSLPALSSQKNFLSRYIKPKRKQVAALLGGNESNK